MAPSGNGINELLHLWAGGDPAALDRLMPLIYGDLRKRARAYMRRQGPEITLQTTAVIHEAYLKLVKVRNGIGRVATISLPSRRKPCARCWWTMRAHAWPANAAGTCEWCNSMRHWTSRAAPSAMCYCWTTLFRNSPAAYPRHGQVVELRYFGGLSVEETARILNISPETVARDWRFAKSFLRAEISRTPAHGTS